MGHKADELSPGSLADNTNAQGRDSSSPSPYREGSDSVKPCGLSLEMRLIFCSNSVGSYSSQERVHLGRLCAIYYPRAGVIKSLTCGGLKQQESILFWSPDIRNQDVGRALAL